MEALLWVACSIFVGFGITITRQLVQITEEVRELRAELHQRLAPLSSQFNSAYQDSNIHDMLAEIHRVVTK